MDEQRMTVLISESPVNNFSNKLGDFMNRLEQAMEFVFKWEGGYVNHPNDPGGETKYGISKRAFPHLDIKAMTKERATRIYKQYYWDAVQADKLESDTLAVAALDTAVNCGVSRTRRWLEAAKGNEKALLEYRKAHYVGLIESNPKRFKVFEKGWSNRLNDLCRTIGIEPLWVLEKQDQPKKKKVDTQDEGAVEVGSVVTPSSLDT